jgi:hypothetical protein
MISTVLEYGSYESFHENDVTSLDLSNHCDEPISDCHDSNCYGSAHFGHGFYYQTPPFQFISKNIPSTVVLQFSTINFLSLVYLDGLFRPPLHTV